MEAAHYRLENLVGIVDRNRLQIDGAVSDVMSIDPLAAKYRAFGWEVLRVNGHEMEGIVEALETAKEGLGKPVLIMAETIKGKGVSFMEDQLAWHYKSPNDEQLARALAELEQTEQGAEHEQQEKPQ